MTVLVTGANGFVGRVLTNVLAKRQCRVRGAIRQHVSANEPRSGIEWSEVGDVGPRTDWSSALRDVQVVVHLVARTHMIRERRDDFLAAYRKVNLEGTRRLAEQAALAGVQRFVFVSSIKVNGERTFDRAFVATDTPAPEDAYGVSKLEAEEALKIVAAEGDMETVIIRPPLIYGPGVKGNFRLLMNLVARGLPLPFGSVNNRRSFIALDNLIDVLLRCLDAPRARNQTLLVSDSESQSTPQLIRSIAAGMGRRAWLLPAPPNALRLFGRVIGRAAEMERLFGSLELDDSETRRLLGWRPLVSAEEAIRATARHFMMTAS
jgi:nucleoside-diphosphate-sugar epimerase